jgi:tRNA pseudouridine(38-40) synthase
MRIALALEYDGSRFLGWQTQPGGGTVQDALQGALAGIAGAAVQVTCAGRTDRGVHAREQIVHFDTAVSRPESAWVRGANALLPDCIAIQWARAVDEDFHARYSAVARSYRFVLLNRPVRPALAARHAGWYHAPLDVDAMRQAAAALVGEHDFSAFRSAECQAKSPLGRWVVARSTRRGASRRVRSAAMSMPTDSAFASLPSISVWPGTSQPAALSEGLWTGPVTIAWKRPESAPSTAFSIEPADAPPASASSAWVRDA